MKLSIIIVNYNTYGLTKQTIESVLEKEHPFTYEIILVDNASIDGSIETLEKTFREAVDKEILHIIKNSANLGFAKASLYYFLKWDKKNPKKYGVYDALHLGEDEVGEVDALMGAFMLMPRSVLDQVGLLDEDFFMYGEDIDLCFRIKQGGYKILYYPKAQIIHYKGGSSKRRRHKVIFDFHEAMWIFYKKHYKKEYNIFITGIVALGIGGKCLLELMKNALKPNPSPERVQNQPYKQDIGG